MIRVITIGGEYASGRAEVADGLASRLGWRLVDKCFIEDIAKAAHVDPDVARQFDERLDPWMHRLHKALWAGGYEGVVTTTESLPLDADAMTAFAGNVIREAAAAGNCVIVGRGSQCVLQRNIDAFHVFIYAPRAERLDRIRQQKGRDADAEALLEQWDRARQLYIRRHFGHEWVNPHLYDMMICSSMGIPAAVEAVLAAVARIVS